MTGTGTGRPRAGIGGPGHETVVGGHRVIADLALGDFISVEISKCSLCRGEHWCDVEFARNAIVASMSDPGKTMVADLKAGSEPWRQDVSAMGRPDIGQHRRSR